MILCVRILVVMIAFKEAFSRVYGLEIQIVDLVGVPLRMETKYDLNYLLGKLAACEVPTQERILV